MRKYAILLALVAGLLAACNDNATPTQVYIVISPTPPSDATDTPPSATASPPADVIAATATNGGGATSSAEATPLATATLAPALYPTNTVAQVAIAEQVFEHGRMFWIRHTLQIWVMEANPTDPNSGDWYCYNDPFVEGEMEIDTSLIPPEGPVQLYQPRRGFGKLWRTNEQIRTALGWATTPEFELTSNYTYIPGGAVQDGTYIPGPGEHRLTTLYNESISFYEGSIRGDCQGGTWRMASGQ